MSSGHSVEGERGRWLGALLVAAMCALMGFSTACDDAGEADPGKVDGGIDASIEIGGGDVSGTDVAGDEGPPDVPADPGGPDIQEVSLFVDLPEIPDEGPDPGPFIDVLDDDLPPTDAPGEVAADVNLGWETFITECEELGIAEAWAGTFLGIIDYDIDSGGLVSPEQGSIEVNGDLGFGIECINSKLVVSGAMSGIAIIENYDETFPFTLDLLGYFDPATGALTADIVDGKVVVYEIFEIYFIGVFNGQLQPDGTFAGDWSGEENGTNVPQITGEAYGDGIWTAVPDTSPPGP